MPETDPSRHIKVRRRGNRLGFWFFKIALKCTGLRGAYGLLYIVCSYYLLFDRSACRAAMAYVSKRFPNATKLKQILTVYLLFVNQGKNLIDRYIILSGTGTFDMTFSGYEEIEPILHDPDHGFILLMSHMGNWQVIMQTIQNLEKTVHLVMRPEDNRAVQDSLNIDGQSNRVRLISPEQFMGGVIEIMNALKAGDMVSMMGDRSYGFASETVHFLGHPAQFACGAFTVAASAQCPVIVLLPHKVSTKAYHIEMARVFLPETDSTVKKRDAIKSRLQEYATLLESYVNRYPLQCFLFYDIWAETPNKG